MTADPRYIPPSDRVDSRCDGDDFRVHAAFMDERDARQRDLIRDLENTVEACEQVIEVGKANETRQRDLIRRLADEIDMWVDCYPHDTPDETKDLLEEARGIEATNE